MYQKFIDEIGKKYGRLLILSRESNRSEKAYFLCQCDCGNKKVIQGYYLRKGLTKSCGCLRVDCLKKTRLKHGKKYTRIYRIWRGIKNRCLNKNERNFKNYGGRGITVCNRWKNSFKNFYEDVGSSYEEHVKKFGEKNTTIDRIDNYNGYFKENCRWATLKEQANNKRPYNKLIKRKIKGPVVFTFSKEEIDFFY